MTSNEPGPLGLYVHFPWCVAKCPYCDFNSHPLRGSLDEDGYRRALLEDLQATLDSYDDQRSGSAAGPQISSVFFGGGTPSLFSPATFGALLDALAPRLAPEAEVTMEANPGSTEYHDFRGYRSAGVNRLSLGAQSFDDAALKRLGRIHGAAETGRAYERAASAGFDRINLDLMYGLPEQTEAGALEDLAQAFALGPEHLSWYQLTLEPRTEFYGRPPPLPGDDRLAAMDEAGRAALTSAGYARYEVSAFARRGAMSQHNLTYWTFGDYLGVGAGAHGKWRVGSGETVRTHKPKPPRLYLQAPAAQTRETVAAEALPAEFAMNALRLVDGVPSETWTARTGLPAAVLAPAWDRLAAMGLMRRDRFAATDRGYELLDSLIAEFL